MWKTIVERCRTQMTVWRMRIACRIPKVTHNTTAKVARTRLNVTLPVILLNIYLFVPSFIKANVDSFEPFIKVVFEFLLFSVYTRCLYRQTLQISTTFCSLFVWNMKTQLVSFHQYTHALGSCNKIMFK